MVKCLAGFVLKVLLFCWCVWPRLGEWSRDLSGLKNCGCNLVRFVIESKMKDFEDTKWIDGLIASKTLENKAEQPDEPFHHFEASKSVARRFWAAYNSLINGFWGSKIVNGLVGKGSRVASFLLAGWNSSPNSSFKRLKKPWPAFSQFQSLKIRRWANLI